MDRRAPRWSRPSSAGYPVQSGRRGPLCNIYATVLTTLLLAAPDQLSDNQTEIVVVALQESQRASSEEERAWILRRAIDAVASGLP